MRYESVSPSADTVELRQAIIDGCMRLLAHRFFIGTYGNVSVRVEDGLMVTPSALPYETLEPDDMVVVDWKGAAVLRGRRVPSSETEMHRRLLLFRSDLGAIVHTHSPFASALACAHRGIPVCVEDMAHLIGGEVRCAPYVCGSDHVELADIACEYMGEDSTAVLLANHGVIVGGRNLAEAMMACEVIEKAAQITLLAGMCGGVTSLTPEMVTEERQRLLYRYGRKADGALIHATEDSDRPA